MIRVGAHALMASETPETLQQKPLFVYSCGYQYFHTNGYSIRRPEGRDDYQLLYIHKGSGHFLLDSVWEQKPAGSIVLYRPLQSQIYSYRACETPEVYWIHFLGQEAAALLSRYQIETCFVGVHHSLKQIFEEIILELTLHKSMYQEIAEADLHKMMACIRRFVLLQDEPQNNMPQINRLLTHLNKHYMEPWSLNTMADYCGLSPSYFSHQFKRLMGASPVQYLNQLRIEQAKEFLQTAEGFTVAEVSGLVGFQDPLYFSRLFKKRIGISPSAFRGNQFSVSAFAPAAGASPDQRTDGHIIPGP